jgi:hypothetical protein
MKPQTPPEEFLAATFEALGVLGGTVSVVVDCDRGGALRIAQELGEQWLRVRGNRRPDTPVSWDETRRAVTGGLRLLLERLEGEGR